MDSYSSYGAKSSSQTAERPSSPLLKLLESLDGYRGHFNHHQPAAPEHRINIDKAGYEPYAGAYHNNMDYRKPSVKGNQDYTSMQDYERRLYREEMTHGKDDPYRYMGNIESHSSRKREKEMCRDDDDEEEEDEPYKKKLITETGMSSPNSPSTAVTSKKEKQANANANQKKKKPTNLNKECWVCGAPAAEHIHYGAICCYSCRAFFRRSGNRNYVCINRDGNCEINAKYRKYCKKCRYKKAIAVGMKPELVDASLRNKEADMKAVAEGMKTSPGPEYSPAKSAGSKSPRGAGKMPFYPPVPKIQYRDNEQIQKYGDRAKSAMGGAHSVIQTPWREQNAFFGMNNHQRPMANGGPMPFFNSAAARGVIHNLVPDRPDNDVKQEGFPCSSGRPGPDLFQYGFNPWNQGGMIKNDGFQCPQIKEEEESNADSVEWQGGGRDHGHDQSETRISMSPHSPYHQRHPSMTGVGSPREVVATSSVIHSINYREQAYMGYAHNNHQKASSPAAAMGMASTTSSMGSKSNPSVIQKRASVIQTSLQASEEAAMPIMMGDDMDMDYKNKQMERDEDCDALLESFANEDFSKIPLKKRNCSKMCKTAYSKSMMHAPVLQLTVEEEKFIDKRVVETRLMVTMVQPALHANKVAIASSFAAFNNIRKRSFEQFKKNTETIFGIIRGKIMHEINDLGLLESRYFTCAVTSVGVRLFGGRGDRTMVSPEYVEMYKGMLTSPWACSYEDEEKVMDILKRTGDAISNDEKMEVMFTTCIMRGFLDPRSKFMTMEKGNRHIEDFERDTDEKDYFEEPGHPNRHKPDTDGSKCACDDPNMLTGVQFSLLLYRYLKHAYGMEVAQHKFKTLEGLVHDLYEAQQIFYHGRLNL